MTEQTSSKSGAMHQVENPINNTMTLRVPKPNMQVAVLGLVAFITLFQTVQLVKIGANAGSAPVKAAPAVTTTSSGGTGGGVDVPQSMVGGC